MYFIELSVRRNIGDGVSDNVTCHWHIQVFLKALRCMRQNIPLLQHTKCSPTNNTPLYKITSSAKQVICARFHGCKNENFNHICSSVRMLQNVAHWTDILQ